MTDSKTRIQEPATSGLETLDIPDVSTNTRNNEFKAQAILAQAGKASSRLESWLAQNGWAGYDPYDIRGTRWYLALERSQSLSLRMIRRGAFWSVFRFPLQTRKLARVDKAVNPKGMGLFTSAFCRLYETTEDPVYLARARESGDWLLAHSSNDYPGTSWGYPFDWQSVVFIPKGTPSAVVSSIVGDGLWRLAHLTGESKYLDACVGVCEFILNGLNRTVIDEQTLCFSYTPLDDFLVHNANLLAAEFVARVAAEVRRPEWTEVAVRAGNFCLLEQREDGSVYYWGKAQNQNAPNHRDCYHSGFEIRSLWGLWEATADARFRDAALKYFDFFENAYITEHGSVNNLPGRLFPIDIHACAEALLCPAFMMRAAPERCLEIISRVLPWTISEMQNDDGSFANMAFEDGRVDRMPYIRWGQAWMLRALAEVQFAARHEQNIQQGRIA